MEPIAATAFKIQTPGGKDLEIKFSLARPEKDADGVYGCSISLNGLPGLDMDNKTIYGETSFQALWLSLEFIRKLLGDARKRGFKVETPWLPGFMPLPNTPRNASPGDTGDDINKAADEKTDKT